MEIHLNKIYMIVPLLLLLIGCGRTNQNVYIKAVGAMVPLLNDFGALAKEEMKVDGMRDDLEPENPEPEVERHAFIMENGLVFVADLPEDWRYVLSPIYEYAYYKNLVANVGGDIEDDCRIELIGCGERDGEDNFFIVTVKKGKKELINDYPITTNPFLFSDGKKGEWSYKLWEDYLRYAMGDIRKIYYEGVIQDLETENYIYLLMLKDEYDANEREIMKFLESACFRENDLGMGGENNILERESLTLHIWDRYMNFSVSLPEGVIFEKKKFANESRNELFSYVVYLDEKKENYIRFSSDQGGEIKDRSGDYRYYLNTEDFDNVVYVIPDKRGYYFPNHNLMIWTRLARSSKELEERIKQIVQSVHFE